MPDTAARTLSGVPALRAHPSASGPETNQMTSSTGATATAAKPSARPRGRDTRPAPTRSPAATSTATTQAAVNTSTSPVRASEPVPRPCNTATGQHAYASQCTNRQVVKPIRWRSRLVTTNARSRSTATAPRPSQNGRYADTNGTTTSIQRIGANESATTVTTWMARNTSTSSETLRCTNSTTKRGHVGLLQRNDVKIPSSTLAVRNPRVTTPVAARDVPRHRATGEREGRVHERPDAPTNRPSACGAAAET